MMAYVCKYCVTVKGVVGRKLKHLPQTQEEFYQHIESEHHIPVQRRTETKNQALTRFQQNYPDAGTDKCKCATCLSQRFMRILNA